MIIKTMQMGDISTNCYLVWDESGGEAFVVDPADSAPAFFRAIKDEGLDLRYIILTHGHGDHIGGVPMLKREYPDAKLAVGREEETMLADPNLNFSLATVGYELALKPDILLSDGDALKVGNMTLSIIETPGHTNGGICILTDKTLFSGDTLFRLSIGRTDFPMGDYDTLARSVREKLFALPDDTEVLPGHMDKTAIGFEKANNPFV
jgi:glyoxylase-like metal-dependent hydrolase (beta-lactamase superfamily II)